MSEQSNGRNRRPGPVGFHGEGKITSQPANTRVAQGTASDATGPTLETPKGSKPLRPTPHISLVLAGVALIAVGLLFFPVLAALGAFMILGAGLERRRIRTETRLREKQYTQGAD